MLVHEFNLGANKVTRIQFVTVVRLAFPFSILRFTLRSWDLLSPVIRSLTTVAQRDKPRVLEEMNKLKNDL